MSQTRPRNLFHVTLTTPTHTDPDTTDDAAGEPFDGPVEIWHADQVMAERYGRLNKWRPLDKATAQEWTTLWLLVALKRLGVVAPYVEFEDFLPTVRTMEPIKNAGAVDPTRPAAATTEP